MDASLYQSMTLGAKLGIVGLLIFVGFFILWVSAIVSVIRNKQIATAGEKVGWIVLNLFTGVIGSIIYFFKFRFLKRAWATFGLVAAFIVLVVVYAVVQSRQIVFDPNDPWASCPVGQDCGISVGNGDAKDTVLGDYVKFSDPAFSFQIEYPEDASLTPIDNPDVGIKVVTFALLLSGDANEMIFGNVTVSESDITESGMTSEQYLQQLIKTATQSLSGSLEAEVLEFSEVDVSGVPARKLVVKYTRSMPFEGVSKELQVFAVKDNRAFIFNFSSDEAGFEQLIGIAEHMADSLQIK